VAQHPAALAHWREALAQAGDWKSVFLASALDFPKLALGLSGFETGVSVMPLVRGADSDGQAAVPHGRIRGTRKLLLSAALLMSALLLSSSFVTAVLVPPEAYQSGGAASGRAIAFLAHGLLGTVFGSIYDLSTIAILWFAGASAMAGLINLIPRYLPRFGMAPRWTALARPLVLALFAVMVFVTLVFRADVEAQAGAYATGVLVLMLSAACAVSLTFWSEAPLQSAQRRLRWRAASALFAFVAAVFLFTLLDNVHERPDGLIISACFVAAIMVLGALSRYRRSTELRVADICLADSASVELWPTLLGKRVNLVPMRTSTPEVRRAKAPSS
jgi:hypothetical protein